MLKQKTRWRYVHQFLAQPTFRQQVLSLQPQSVPRKAVDVAVELAISDNYDSLLRIREVGPFPAVIAAWTVSMLRVLAKSAQGV
jgi:hypothetical protein